MLGSLLLTDPVVPVHGMLSIYTTSSNLTLAYNIGAAAGICFSVQVISGVLVALTYVASDACSFSTLDTLH